jgi:isopentenyl diphosphate isomerase/L-lactate dehydrogenase-like FMN-dependent dehydrogenase
VLDGGVPKVENIVVPGQGPMPLIDVTASLGRSAVTWTDLRWIRESWKGPIIIKGVLIADDARRAVDEGTSAIVVSNHGARQLDCVLPTIRALPEIVAAVGGKSEILMDGGIRRGSDIVKALCLGARAVLIGRANANGLAAAGQAGVERAIKIWRDDVERTLRLLGCGSMQELNTSFIKCPCEWRKVADA